MSEPASPSSPSDRQPPVCDGLPLPRRNWAAAALLLALLMAVVDSSIANVALPTIARDFGVTSAEVVWIVNAYNLTVVCMLLPLSALAERIGFRRVFAGGVVLFTLASLVSALSTSLAMLTAARVAQGLGAAAIMSLIGGFMRYIYPIRLLGQGLSLNAMTVGVSSVLGPTIGSAILAVATWPWIFAVSVPVGLVALYGVRALPDIQRVASPFDWRSAAFSMLTLALVIVGIDHLVSHPWQAAGLLVLGAAAAVLLVRRASGQTAPLVPVDLLRIRPVAFAVGASVFSFAAQMGSFVAVPFYFLQVLGRDYLTVGILISAWPVGAAIMAPIAGRLSDKYSAALLCAIGAAGMAAGLAWLMVLPPDCSNAAIMAGMGLAGVGFGFFQTPNNRAMLGATPRSRSGAAGGMQATTRVFGQSVGTALTAVAFGLRPTGGATLALALCSACALGALAVNAVRLKADRPVPL